MKTGYYRYKMSDLTPGTYNYNWYIDGEFAGTSKVIIKEYCTDDKYLKYLDTKGIYRYYPFNNRWSQVDSPKQIGESNNIITSLKDALSDTKNIGYRTDRILSLVAPQVSTEELEILSDIFTSPRVYLNTVGKEDWVLVTLSGDGLGRRRKKDFGSVTVNIKLPEHYSVTSL